MSRHNICPSDVLRQFIEEVKLAHDTGDGDKPHRTALGDDWPDPLVTYDQALAVLEPDDPTAPARHVVAHVEAGAVSEVTTRPRCRGRGPRLRRRRCRRQVSAHRQ